jgi:DNA transformation protein and related proteins
MAEKFSLRRLKNIGATVAERLHEIGVFNREDLKRIGAPEAYRRIKQKHPEITLPRCYYLYSLEGALRDVHWDSIPDALKRRLSQQAGFVD